LALLQNRVMGLHMPVNPMMVGGNQAGQGVIPDPNQGNAPPSASRPWTNPTQTKNFAPAAGMRPMHQMRRRFADGGSVDNEAATDAPDQSQSDGTPQQATDAAADHPLDMINQALQYGRQQAGLPAQFFTDTTASPENPINTPQARMLLGSGVMGSAPWKAGRDAWEKFHGPGPASLAAGGAVPDDSDQGVIPDGSQSQGGAPQAMGYLMGKGAASPDQVAALEGQADPSGTMDPNERKVKALASLGSPEKMFPVLQHYRQKFNAYSAFARAAARGVQGKPPDMQASAAAATKAYEHVPDGNSIHFQPVQNGMHVTVRPVVPRSSAGNTQKFEDGGPVIPEDSEGDVTGTVTQANDQTDQTDQTDQSGDADTTGSTDNQQSTQDTQATETSRLKQDAEGVKGAAGDVKKAFTPNFDNPTANALKNIYSTVLSIPQYLGWISDKGHMDAVMEKGAQTTLQEAAQPSTVQPSTAQPQSTAKPAYTMQPAPGQREAAMAANEEIERNKEKPFEPWAPEDASKDLKNLARQMFPFVGQNQQRLAFINQEMEKEAERGSKENVARLTGEGKLNVANVAAGARRDVNAATNQSRQDIAAGTNQTRRDIAAGHDTARLAQEQLRQKGLDARAVQQQLQSDLRTIVGNNPSLGRNPDKLADIVGQLGQKFGLNPQQAIGLYNADLTATPSGGTRQQQAPAGNQGPLKFYNGKWYKRGPNGEAIPVQ